MAAVIVDECRADQEACELRRIERKFLAGQPADGLAADAGGGSMRQGVWSDSGGTGADFREPPFLRHIGLRLAGLK